MIYPNLGNCRLKTAIVLTQPELFAIAAAIGFTETVAKRSTPNFWDHYGPNLLSAEKRLRTASDRLQVAESTSTGDPAGDAKK